MEDPNKPGQALNTGSSSVLPAAAPSKKAKKPTILKNVLGEVVEESSYFYSKTKPGQGEAPPSFNKVCGNPVDREELIEVFKRVFDVKKDVLFYKSPNKEVYLVIVPLKYSSSVGADHESIDGDFQVHSMSFISEGSVNLTTLRTKLQKIVPFLKNTDN